MATDDAPAEQTASSTISEAIISVVYYLGVPGFRETVGYQVYNFLWSQVTKGGIFSEVIETTKPYSTPEHGSSMLAARHSDRKSTSVTVDLGTEMFEGCMLKTQATMSDSERDQLDPLA